MIEQYPLTPFCAYIAGLIVWAWLVERALKRFK